MCAGGDPYASLADTTGRLLGLDDSTDSAVGPALSKRLGETLQTRVRHAPLCFLWNLPLLHESHRLCCLQLPRVHTTTWHHAKA